MGYGQVAVDAVGIYQTQIQDVLQAWSRALVQNNLPDKTCPRVAFLGLCENGYVIGVPNGTYIKKRSPSIIKQNAVGIRNIIMNSTPPALPLQKNVWVWTQVGGTGSDQGVIRVVYDLFINNLLQ